MKLGSHKYRIVGIVLMLFISTGLAAAQAAPLQGLDDYVAKAMKDWEIPGLAIAVVKDDKIVFAKGYGVRELGKQEPVTENTLFAIGSSSKAFTAATLAILVDEGKLKWDDPVTKYLPGFQLYDPYVTREMTVRDMLTHRIGLERGDLLWYASGYDRNEVLRRVRHLKPSSSVRSKFGYQNIMYLAAGQIVESVTGKTWDQFTKERLFIPLNMKSSGTTIRELANFKDVASPHASINDKVKPVAWRNIDNIAPAGSINSNVVDVAQWLRLQLGTGKYDGKQLITAANVKTMHSSQTIIPLEGLYTSLYSEAHFLNYGMGWFLSDFRGRKMVEHGGAIDGMRSAVAMIPEEKLGVVVLGNMNGSVLPQMLANRIFDMYLGQQKDWSGDTLKVLKALEAQGKTAAQKIENDRVKGTSPSLDLAKYAGDYQSEMYGDAGIVFENGKLKAKFGPNFNGELEHWNFDTFRVTWRDEMQGKAFINFKLNSQGKIESMTIEGISEFKRVPEKAAAK